MGCVAIRPAAVSGQVAGRSPGSFPSCMLLLAASLAHHQRGPLARALGDVDREGVVVAAGQGLVPFLVGLHPCCFEQKRLLMKGEGRWHAKKAGVKSKGLHAAAM